MSSENVAIVRRSYDAYARGDLDAVLNDADPELITYREDPDGAIFRGRDGLLQAIAEWMENFDDFTLSVEELIDAPDDHVIAHVHQTAVGAQSGAPIEADFWFVHELQAGKVIRLDMLVRKERALEVAGIRTT